MYNDMEIHMKNISNLVGRDVSDRYASYIGVYDLIKAYVDIKKEIAFGLTVENKIKSISKDNKKMLDGVAIEIVNNNIMRYI